MYSNIQKIKQFYAQLKLEQIYNAFILFIISIIFLIANWSGKKGKKTINEMTYLAGGRPEMRQQADTFLYKNVTKRHIERNTGGGSGGGGGHMSAGGSSFGGGGHSR